VIGQPPHTPATSDLVLTSDPESCQPRLFVNVAGVIGQPPHTPATSDLVLTSDPERLDRVILRSCHMAGCDWTAASTT
nr:hypothetical protein [Tanacetum cinerariifolium]